MQVIDKITNQGTEVWFKAGRKYNPEKFAEKFNIVMAGYSLNKRCNYDSQTKRPKLESLEAAISEYTTSLNNFHTQATRYYSRALYNRQGREIYKESRGTLKNHVQPVASFGIGPDGDPTLISFAKGPDDLPVGRDSEDIIKASVKKSFHAWENTIGARQINDQIEAVLWEIQATRIHGKRSWFFESKWQEMWIALGAALKGTEIKTNSPTQKWYHQPYILDGSSLEALQESIDEEIRTTIDPMLEEIQLGTFTDRKAKHRLKTLEETVEKMTRYEALFNKGLDSCRHRLTEVVSAINLATTAEGSGTGVEDEMFSI